MSDQKHDHIDIPIKIYVPKQKKSPTEKLIVGKRKIKFDAGYVYAPYIPLWTTPLIHDPNDFTPRRGVMTRYAKKMVNGNFFATVTLAAS